MASSGISRTFKKGMILSSQIRSGFEEVKVVPTSICSCKNYSSINLPDNVKELNQSEKVQFSTKRSRDMTSARISSSSGSITGHGVRNIKSAPTPVDSHASVYDSTTTVSLSSVMQTNVPHPFKTDSNTDTPFNMPGGQRAQEDKYISGDLQDHHSARLMSKPYKGIHMLPLNLQRSSFNIVSTSYSALTPQLSFMSSKSVLHRSYSQFSAASSVWCGVNLNENTAWYKGVSNGFGKGQRVFINTEQSKDENTPRQKLKKAVKEYGATVIIFHVTISLASLGFFYLLVSSGIDMTGVIKSLNINLESLQSSSNESGQVTVDNEIITEKGSTSKIESTVVAGVSTFVIAYAIHKVFAPARIAITLSSTPFIVRYLRSKGILKAKK